MAEIQWRGSVWRGVVVGVLGVLTTDTGDTYAGGVAGGSFDGRGVVQGSDGDTEYCELAAGEYHGYREVHSAGGGVYYFLHERGKYVHSAHVSANGRCLYDGEFCGADHAGLVALKAGSQQATVRPPQPQPLAIRPRRRGVLCASCVRACRTPRWPSRISDAALCACACARACLCQCMHARAREHACIFVFGGALVADVTLCVSVGACVRTYVRAPDNLAACRVCARACGTCACTLVCTRTRVSAHMHFCEWVCAGRGCDFARICACVRLVACVCVRVCVR